MSDLVQAWQLWATGQTPELSFVGLSLRWWGRIGKLLEFFAALTIVAEIIGPQRLRVFGNGLHSKITAAGMWRLFRNAYSWYFAYWKHAAADNKTPEETAAVEKHPAFVIHITSTWIFAVYATILIWPQFSGWKIFLIVIGLFVLSALIIGPLAAVVVISVVACLGYIADIAVVEPIAWVLDRDALDRWVKVVALLMLVIGFHFDLLYS